MSQYENEFSNFPQQLITLHNFKNIDDTVGNLINKINSYRSQGAYTEAVNFIQNNPSLSQYVVDAVTFRTWEEEIYNVQKYAKQQQQSIYFEEDELEVLAYVIEGDVWLGGV